MTGEQALRFAGPATADGAGHGLVVATTGTVATVAGTDAIRQALFLLLGTRPGERVMRPRYGSHLHRLLFAPNDHTTAGLAIHYVRQAVQRWEPRVEILDIDAEADAPHRLLVRLRYRVREHLAEDTLELALDLEPAEAGGAP